MPEAESTAPAQATTEASDGKETTTEETKVDTVTEDPKAEEKDGAEDKGEQAKPGTEAPEKYDLSLTDGSLLDDSSIEKISTYAREKGLSNEAAQELLTREEQAVASFHEAQAEEVSEIRATWVKEAEKDKEIGGEAFKKNAELSNRVVERFGSDEFKKVLKETGFGDHPEVVRTFVRIGKMMSEDELVMPKSQSTGKDKSAADALYPTTAT